MSTKIAEGIPPPFCIASFARAILHRLGSIFNPYADACWGGNSDNSSSSTISLGQYLFQQNFSRTISLPAQFPAHANNYRPSLKAGNNSAVRVLGFARRRSSLLAQESICSKQGVQFVFLGFTKRTMVEEVDLAIDDAIAYLDSLIRSLQTTELRPHVEEEKGKRTDACVASVAGGNTSAATVDEVPFLDIPRKHPLKLPGSTAKQSVMELIPEHADNFNKAHIQVGVVQSVADHPIAEKLYVCKIEVANGEIRQVVAGLRKFIPVSELEGKKVCVIINLKPAKLAGQSSEAMVLAGDAQANGLEIVKVLEPPADAAVGDRIYVQGHAATISPAKQLSSKIWEKIVSLLTVEGGVATFAKVPLATARGLVKVPELPDGAGIH